MKTIDGPSKIRFLFLMILAFLIMFSCMVYHNYYTFNSIKVVTKKSSTAVEYGSANYDINNVIKKVEGEIVSIKNGNIDTKVVGDYEVTFKVKKENVTKEIPIVVSVKDTAAPIIQLKSDTVTITQGDDYDLTWNVESVYDEIDGDIYYCNENITEDSVSYYHFGYDPATIDDVGSHEVSVHAKDSHGNLSIAIFTLVVEERKQTFYYQPKYVNAAPIPAAGDVVSLAWAYLGYPYAANGKGPYAFDCSGFVHYLYSQFGIYVSGSTWGQLYDGVPVSYEDIVPGDIILWGNGGVSHSALYVGDGQMIHAANYSQGVILSSVDQWRWGSGTYIVSVRRVQ